MIDIDKTLSLYGYQAVKKDELEALRQQNAQLLEACQFTLANLDYIQNLWGKEGITDHVADRLRAAIAAAEGSS